MGVDILPWVLSWPPSRRTVAVFLLVTAASVGTIALLGGVPDIRSDGNITVSDVDVSVRLNDDPESPDTNGTVQTCIGSGTPGDHLSVLGEVTVRVPPGRQGDARAVVLWLDDTHNRTLGTIDETGSVTKDVFWLVEDDERLSVGDTTTVEARVRGGGTTVASRTLSVPVENGTRSYDCSVRAPA